MTFRIKAEQDAIKNGAGIKRAPKVFDAFQRAALKQVAQDIFQFTRVGIERGNKSGNLYRVYGKGANKRLGGLYEGSISGALNRKGKVAKKAKGQRTGGLHRASAPGEYPGIVSGGLIKRLKAELKGNQAEVGFLSVGGKTEDLPIWLENGTKKIGKRKLLSNSIQERQGQAYNYLDWTRKLRNM